MIAVGRASFAIGVTISYFNVSSRWLAASIRPTRPKNGSLATTASTASPSRLIRSTPRFTHSSRWASAPSGSPRYTYSRWRKACMRAGSSDGSCRKQ